MYIIYVYMHMRICIYIHIYIYVQTYIYIYKMRQVKRVPTAPIFRNTAPTAPMQHCRRCPSSSVGAYSAYPPLIEE